MLFTYLKFGRSIFKGLIKVSFPGLVEINPSHPLIKELLRRVKDNPADKTASVMAVMMYNTATLR
jgi:hypothetical protein